MNLVTRGKMGHSNESNIKCTMIVTTGKEKSKSRNSVSIRHGSDISYVLVFERTS